MTLEDWAYRREYIEKYLLSTLRMAVICDGYEGGEVPTDILEEFPGMTERMLGQFSNTSKAEEAAFYREHWDVFRDSPYYEDACKLADQELGLSVGQPFLSWVSGKLEIFRTVAWKRQDTST